MVVVHEANQIRQPLPQERDDILGDLVGLPQPEPTSHPRQDPDLGAAKHLMLAVRLQGGDVGIGVYEPHQRVGVVLA